MSGDTDNLLGKKLTHYPGGSVLVQPRSRMLLIARVVWIALATLSVGIFLIGVPFRFRQLTSPCAEKECAFLQLSFEEAQALQEAGLSLRFLAAYDGVLSAVLMLVFAGLAVMIFWRRSGEWTALLVSLWLVTFGTTVFATTLALAEAFPIWEPLISFVDGLGWVFLLPLFLFIFPDGRFTPRWTRWLFTIWMVWGIVGIAIEQFFSDVPASEMVTVVPWVSMQLTGVGAQVYRYVRVSDGVQRQQTKWVVFGLVGTVVVLIVADLVTSGSLVPGQSGLSDLIRKLAEPALVTIAMLIIPLSFTFAILRYRLWDIDMLINRTLVYGSLTVVIVGLYALVVGGLGALVQTSGNLLLSILATGLIAILFHPLRQRLQQGVNRLMYGERDDPYAVLTRLGQQLEATLAPDAVLPTIAETLAHSLKLPYVAISLKQGEKFVDAATYGSSGDELLHLPLVYQAKTVGELILSPRGSGEALTPADHRLLNDLTHQIGVAAHAVRLTMDLQRMTRDLQHSRERLVLAREEERRRLRRDLHDGLAPTLAALALAASTAGDLIPSDPEAAASLVAELHTEIRSAVSDIRRLVYELRPPTLDELGLVAA
jgi:signal transduction histidine kinase